MANINPPNFVYPHRIGMLFDTPPPIHENDSIDWDCVVVGRVWDLRVYDLNLVQQLVDRHWHLRQPVRVRRYGADFLFQCQNEEDAEDLDVRGWVHFKGSLVVLQRVRGDTVVKDLSLNYGELWVKVDGLPLQYSTPEVASALLSHVGDVTMVEEAQYPVACPRVKVLVNLGTPLIPGCYFPTSDNRITWVQFRYKGNSDFAKSVVLLDTVRPRAACRQQQLARCWSAAFIN